MRIKNSFYWDSKAPYFLKTPQKHQISVQRIGYTLAAGLSQGDTPDAFAEDRFYIFPKPSRGHLFQTPAYLPR
jgi:hypothetical protein